MSWWAKCISTSDKCTLVFLTPPSTGCCVLAVFISVLMLGYPTISIGSPGNQTWHGWGDTKLDLVSALFCIGCWEYTVRKQYLLTQCQYCASEWARCRVWCLQDHTSVLLAAPWRHEHNICVHTKERLIFIWPAKVTISLPCKSPKYMSVLPRTF